MGSVIFWTWSNSERKDVSQEIPEKSDIRSRYDGKEGRRKHENNDLGAPGRDSVQLP
jgi:hypothetical protein